MRRKIPLEKLTKSSYAFNRIFYSKIKFKYEPAGKKRALDVFLACCIKILVFN